MTDCLGFVGEGSKLFVSPDLVSHATSLNYCFSGSLGMKEEREHSISKILISMDLEFVKYVRRF